MCYSLDLVERDLIPGSVVELGRARAFVGRHRLRVLEGAAGLEVALIEPAPPVLARALEPFPIPLRTLDALHVASVEFLRDRGLTVELASYDERMLAAARALRIPLFAL